MLVYLALLHHTVDLQHKLPLQQLALGHEQQISYLSYLPQGVELCPDPNIFSIKLICCFEMQDQPDPCLSNKLLDAG